jgi:hypothetical protein
MRGGASLRKSALPLTVLPDVRRSKSQAFGFSSASQTAPQLPVNGAREAASAAVLRLARFFDPVVLDEFTDGVGTGGQGTREERD